MSELINLKIKSDFDQAEADLKKFGQTSEAEAQRIKKFAESFKTEQLERFMQKQERNAVVMTATRGKVEALSIEHRNLQREIERLINKGLDPNDAALAPLITKYGTLTNELEQAKRKTEELRQKTEQQRMAMDQFRDKSIEGAKRALTSLAAAAAAALVAVGKMTIDLAKQGDELSENAEKVGISTKAYQELSFAANMMDVSSESLTKGFQKLNVSVSELQSGNGKLADILKTSNPQLLEQFKNVGDTEQAFNLAITAISGAKDEFERAAIAQAAFGKSGKDIILMTKDGVSGIDALRNEVERYGIMNDETIAKAEAFDASQKRLTATIEGLKIKLFSGMIPGITEAVDGFQKWISTGDNLENTMKIIGYALAGAAAGLTAFMLVAKGAAIIEQLSIAFKALTAAVASNPIGAIAVVVSTIAVPAMIALFNQTDKITNLHKSLDAQTEKLKTTFSDYADIQKKLNDKTITLTESEKILLELRKEQLANEMVANLDKEIKTLSSLSAEIKKQEDAVAKTGKRYEEVAKIKREIETLQIEAIKNGKSEKEVTLQYAASLKEANMNLVDVNTTMAKQKSTLDSSKIVRQETIDQLAEAVNLGYLDVGMIKLSNKALGEEVALRAQVIEKEKQQVEKKSAGIKITAEDMEEQEKANKRALEMATAFKQQIEDLNATKERAIELEFERKKADIEASEASVDAQKDAISWARKLADEKLRLLKTEAASTATAEVKDMNKDLKERLTASLGIEKIYQNDSIIAFSTFLKTKMDMENVAGQGRIMWLDQELKTIQSRTDLSNEEKLAAEKAVREMALDIYKSELSEKDKLLAVETKKIEDENKKRADDLKETLAKNLDEFNKYSGALADLIGGITNLFIADNNAKLEDAKILNEELTAGEIAYNQIQVDQAKKEVENNKTKLFEMQKDLENSKTKESDKIIELQEKIGKEKDAERKKELQKDLEEEKAKEERRKIDLQKEIDSFKAQIDMDAARTKAEEERAAKDAEFKKEERKIIRENAIASRVAAVADIAAKTAQSIAASWAASPATFGLPWSALAAGMGILQTAAVLKPPLPTAQTGTISSGMEIPDTGSTRGRLDRVGVMASPGETVHVTPRGQTRQQRTVIQIDKKVILDIVSDGFESGDLYITSDNIRGTISA